MEIAIPAFPGDLPSLTTQIAAIARNSMSSLFDRVHILLITHRRDRCRYREIKQILLDTLLLAEAGAASNLNVTSFDELFPGAGGHTNSATAKKAAVLSFAARFADDSDILFLLDGEVPVSRSAGSNRSGGPDSGAGGVASRPSSLGRLQADHANRMLGLANGDSSTIVEPERRSFLLRAEDRRAIGSRLRGGLQAAADALLEGSTICDLAELTRAWIARSIPPLGGSEDDCEWEIKPADFAIGSLDSGQQAAIERASANIAKLEDFDADLAHRVIAGLDELRDRRVSFVQVGANDGQFADPISPFVNPSTWSGLVIEPVPIYFQCLERRYADFPNILPLQIAIGRSPAQRPMYFVADGLLTGSDDSYPQWLRGIASFSIAHLLEHGVSRDCIDSVLVKSEPGEAIIRHYMNGPFDLLVIDVEGAEREVLESFGGFDPGPACIIFESEHISEIDEAAIRRLLQNNGYRVRWARPDAVAIHGAAGLDQLLADQDLRPLAVREASAS